MLNWIVWNRTISIKIGLALNNLQMLICHKTNQPTNESSGMYGITLSYLVQSALGAVEQTDYLSAEQ